MANKQTTSLRKRGLSLKFNKSVDFAHCSGRERLEHPEFTLVERPTFKGSACPTAFGTAASKRTRAWRGAGGK